MLAVPDAATAKECSSGTGSCKAEGNKQNECSSGTASNKKEKKMKAA